MTEKFHEDVSKLVIGSDGSLGSLIYARAREVFGADSVVAGYHRSDSRIVEQYPDALTVQVDATDEDSIRLALERVDCAILAVPQREPIIQRVAAEAGVSTVDVGAHYAVAAKAIEQINSPGAFQMVCAGQAPGVTGLMARGLYEQTGEPVIVGFLLAKGGRSGRVGVADMLGIIDKSSKELTDFDFHGVGVRRVVPAELNEMSIISGGGVPMESVVAFESALENRMILALRRIGLLRLLYSTPWLLDRLAKTDKPTTDEAIYIGATSGDQRIDVRSESDYLAAAHAAVAFAKLGLARNIHGVSIPAQHFQLDEVIAECNGVIKRVESTQPR